MNEDYEWDQAVIKRLQALSDEELVKEMREIMASKNEFSYTPGSQFVLNEIANRLEKSVVRK